MSYAAYLDAEKKINQGLIRRDLSLARGENKPADPPARMAEMQSFLDACGNPERGIPAVHVAGTSGKGSVACGIAGILTEAGLKVGLHVSPYLQSATEKIWVGDRFVSPTDFLSLVDWVMPVARPRVHPDTRASIHGMASVAVALEGFKREKVDVMVFEAGCGGRYDLTSFVETAVAVITNIGLDHVVSLGPTIEDIAWHKAGVARPGAPLITGASDSALGPIRNEAERVGAPLHIVPSGGNALEHNRTLAAKAAREMATILDLPLEEDTITRGLNRVKLAGRSEVMPHPGPRIVIDGAHNAEKLTVAIHAAAQGARSGPRIGVVGFLGTKATPELVRPLANRFDHLIATEPRVYGKTPCPAHQTAFLLSKVGYAPSVAPDMFDALDEAVGRAGPDGNVLVTGSFYLVGELRNRWFSKKQVVLECTSWPKNR
jgi:dihydrofolate synthase/folylpolyglutamate synthase